MRETLALRDFVVVGWVTLAAALSANAAVHEVTVKDSEFVPATCC